MSTYQLLKWAACTVLILGCAIPVQAAQVKERPDDQVRPGTDFLGEPLPSGAIARLGTTRWRHNYSVYRLVLSADGKVLAAQSDMDGVVLSDGRTGQVLHRLPMADFHYNGGFCLSADGKVVVDYQRDRGLLLLFDAVTGKERGRIPLPKSFSSPEALSPDGKLLAITLWTKEGGHEILLWDTVKGVALHQFAGVKKGVVFGSDGKTLITITDKAILLRDVATGKQVRELASQATALALSANGRTLAVLEGTDLRLWDPTTGKERGRIQTALKKGQTRINQLALSADGGVIALGGYEGLLLAWNVATGKEVLRQEGRTHGAHGVALAPDGKTLYWSMWYHPAIHRIDLATGREILATPGHDSYVQSLMYSPDGTTLMSHGLDSQVRFWNAKTGRPALDAKGRERSPIATGPDRMIVGGPAVYSADGNLLAMPLSDQAVCVRVAHSGKLLHELPGVQGCWALAFSPDGKLLAGADRTYEDNPNGIFRLHLWDLTTGKRIHLLQGDGDYIRALAFAPDGKSVAAAGGDVRLYDAATGKPLRQFTGQGGRGSGMVFTPDGRTIIAAGKGVSFWDVATGELKRRLPESDCFALAISRDGKYLATTNADHSIRLWDVATGEPVAKMPGHRLRIEALAFAPDGKTLASGGTDTTILLWDVPAALQTFQLAAMKKPQPGDAEKHWVDLGSKDAAVAYKAIWALVADAGQAVPLVQKRLKPATIKEDDPDALVSGGEALRGVRAVEVLERIGSPAARQVLQKLAGGAEARLTREARAALERLDLMATAAKTVGQPLPLPPDPLDKLWSDLALADATAGHKAVWTLANEPEVALALIKARLKPAAIKAAKDSDGLTVPAGEPLRAVRVVEILERIGTAPAQKLLASLDGVSPRLTREIQAAMKRLKHRDGEKK